MTSSAVSMSTFRSIAGSSPSSTRSQVPRGRNDDYADDISMGLITLREGGFLALTAEYMRRQVEARMFRRKPQTVAEGYGV